MRSGNSVVLEYLILLKMVNLIYRSLIWNSRCFHLAIANSVYSKVNKCDVFIEVPLQNYNMYDINNADKIFETGYNTALLNKEKLMELTKNIVELD
jgi:hypothetical protein